MNIEPIKSSFLDLTLVQRQELLGDLLRMNYVDSDLCLTRRQLLDDKRGCCSHCQSTKYHKHGIDKGSQRYKCKDCGRTFTEYSGTWMDGLHKKELVSDYISLMEQELSLDKIKDRLGINKKTAFDWRHKILSGLQQADTAPFEGITESDDTFFRFSEKGSANLKRNPRKRGGGAKRGTSIDQVAVIVTTDRARRMDLTVARRGRIKKIDIEQAIGARVTSKTILCTDSHATYKGFAIDNKNEHHRLRTDLKQRVKKRVYHIQHVNAIDSRLKRWISGRFGGVSTKYLQKYLDWFRIREMLASSTNYAKEFAEKAIKDITAINTYKDTQEQFEQISQLQR